MVNFAEEAEAQRGCVMWLEPQSSSEAELGLNCARVPASPEVGRLFSPHGFLFLACLFLSHLSWKKELPLSVTT